MIETKEEVIIDEDKLARFEFGKNWRKFLNTLNDERIEIAETSLKDMLDVNDLKGKTFLDIGCGSGIFSLCANKLGAKVHSLDYDVDSVNCTKYLREKYYKESDWNIEQASVLNADHIRSLGKFDIVYSWGVLHHTGNMMLALENATIPVKVGGKLFIAIYNDEGFKSRLWLKVKQIYNANIIGKLLMCILFFPYFMITGFLADIFSRKNPFKRYSNYKNWRGMSILYDWYDWLGGLPFEVASVERIFNFYKERGFILEEVITTNRLGCNQFVFTKVK